LVYLARQPASAQNVPKRIRSLRPTAEKNKKARGPRKPPAPMPVPIPSDVPAPTPAPKPTADDAQAAFVAQGKNAKVSARKLPRQLVLVKKTIRLRPTDQANLAAFAIRFKIPRRPRRARLRTIYAGMIPATQMHFTQQVRLNDTILMDLQARGKTLKEKVEYVQRVPEDLFDRDNRLVYTSQDDGIGQEKNPFRLLGAILEFEW